SICGSAADLIRVVQENVKSMQFSVLGTIEAPSASNGLTHRFAGYFEEVRLTSMRAVLPNVGGWVLGGAAVMSDAEDSNAILQKALTNALKQTEALRKRDRSTYLDCTRVFSEFKNYEQTEPYIKYFNSIGIPAILDDRNQRHYVAFE